MMMERSQALIGLVVAVIVAIGTVYAVGASSGAFRPGHLVSADFTDAAGLERDDFIFVAGVRIGQVERVVIEGDHVRAEFRVDADVPVDSSARIFLTTSLGRRGIRLLPGTSTTYLTEGDHIGVDRTGTPIDLPELGDETVELLAESNVRALRELTTALADITQGQNRNVADLLDGVQRVSDVITSRRAELEQVLVRTGDLVDVAVDKDDQLITIIDEFGSTLSQLVGHRTEITRLLRETAGATDLAADLVEDRRAQLDRVLTELAADLAIVDSHQVDIAHIFAYVGVGFEGFAGIGYEDGDAYNDTDNWGNVFVTSLGPLGIEPLLNCGGVLDDLLTQTVGPDPNCTADGGASLTGVPAPTRFVAPTTAQSLGWFFDVRRVGEVAR